MPALIALALLATTSHPHSAASLVSSVTSARPGKSFLAAIHMTMEPTWHTYWINPGDSGIPPSIAWKLPPGWKAGPIEWQTPEKLTMGGLVSYGYEREALFLIKLTPPANAKPGTSAQIKGIASWLICQRGCIPASEAVQATVKIGEETPNPNWDAKLTQAEQKLPTEAKQADFDATAKDGKIFLHIASALPEGKAKELEFFPMNETIEPAAPQPVTAGEKGFTMELKVSEFASGKITRLRGLLIPPKGVELGDRPGAVVVDIPVRS
jgi:thiol:disulfide interchange protein DsbD